MFIRVCFFRGGGWFKRFAIFPRLAGAEFSATPVADEDGSLIYFPELVGSPAMWANDEHGRIMYRSTMFVSPSGGWRIYLPVSLKG